MPWEGNCADRTAFRHFGGKGKKAGWSSGTPISPPGFGGSGIGWRLNLVSDEADISAAELDFVHIDEHLVDLAIPVLRLLKRRSMSAATAESCTGGLIATVLSEAPGAAEHFSGGFVVYTPEQKSAALGISSRAIKQYGTVSREIAKAMAEAALQRSNADIAVGVTGVAGPDTDEKGNPVGLVYYACARNGVDTVIIQRSFGNVGRSRIRYSAAAEAMIILKTCLS